VIPKETCHLSD